MLEARATHLLPAGSPQQKTRSASTQESSVSQTLVPNGQPVLASLESFRQKWNHSLFSVNF